MASTLALIRDELKSQEKNEKKKSVELICVEYCSAEQYTAEYC